MLMIRYVRYFLLLTYARAIESEARYELQGAATIIAADMPRYLLLMLPCRYARAITRYDIRCAAGVYDAAMLPAFDATLRAVAMLHAAMLRSAVSLRL